ncbi:acetylcholinesterase-like isoform X3 [Vespa mandarinia]|nr:acetylcholinesterase-like isoform X3 [Vespa mandarinia]XP_035719928.1 acetylcholinesterase-like isoform X3 [Vespa mandarinia]XP_035719929.1 acetylcholinesterase-like isoform X3 [Vespa mandarinia]
MTTTTTTTTRTATTTTSTSSTTTTTTTTLRPLDVELPPTLPMTFGTENSTTISAQSGSMALLPCVVHNLGDGVVSWIKRKTVQELLTVGLITYANDERFQAIHFHHSEDWTLQIKYVQGRDAGLYQCQVSTHPPTSIFLFLEVVGKRPPEGWPVMVWFHSGDFNTGTPKIWDASIFVTKQKVLVITVAYRLNILGFFTTTDGEAPGNYGMFDQIAALDWIKKNIERFEGSPTNVIIYGHSSGAICVGLHMMSPLSKGKFSKAIAMSGDAIGSVGSPQTELPVVDFIAEKFGCYRYPTTKLMECLRRVDVLVLVSLSSVIETWGPIIDAETNNGTEPFLPEHPRDILTGGNFNAVPLIAGYTKNEQSLAYIESMTSDDESSDGTLSEKKFESMIIEESNVILNNIEDNSTCVMKPEMLSDAILFYYKPYPPNNDQGVLRDKYLDLQTDKTFASGLTLLAGELSKQETSYVYRFDYRPKTDLMVRDVPEWAGVPHMFDLPFVWGLPLTTTVQWNPADKKMSEVMMMMLANFAKTANPSLNNVKWNPYTINDPGILIIDRNVDMNEPNVIDYRAFAFWNEYYPKVLEEATNNCCNITTSAANKSKLSIEFVFIVMIINIPIYELCFIR